MEVIGTDGRQATEATEAINKRGNDFEGLLWTPVSQGKYI